MYILQMNELELRNKRVMIREDLNVPMQNGVITNDTRLQAALPTIRQAHAQGAAVILLSHLGRPTPGVNEAEFSLAPIAAYLTQHLNQPVKLISDWLDGFNIKPGEIVLCENVRFNAGETNDDPQLASKMAALCDVFIMDAFATAHRAHASTYGVATKAKEVAAGPLLIAELTALSQAYLNPKPPIVAIIGGAKVSTKLILLRELVTKVDVLILGGGLANTFLAAQGMNVGQSLFEANLIDEAKQVATIAAQHGCQIPLPLDVIVAPSLTITSATQIKLVTKLGADDMIGDIGPQTIQKYNKYISQAQTIIWNGPLGVFEIAAFAKGTQAIAEAVANSQAFSLAGGGDTLAAIDHYHLNDKLSYISTGGGALLEFLEGRHLPAIEILYQRSAIRDHDEQTTTH